MKRILFFLSVLFAVVLWQSCEKEVLPGSIYGVVTDKAIGEPIKSAGVELNPGGLKTVTGSEGQFEFVDLTPGKYNLIITKTGYVDFASSTIEVKEGQTAKSDVQMEKLPPSLRVVDDNNEDIDLLDFGADKSDITRSFNIFNDGEASIEWEITYTAEWIKKVSKMMGILKAGATQALVVTIDRDKLSGGENITTFHITSDNGSKQLTIKAHGDTKPVLNMVEVGNITKSGADFYGEIVNVGDPAYTERGFVYSNSPMPTLESTISKITAVVNDSKSYNSSVSGLSTGNTYYVRAYAINGVGVSYSSNEIKFSTIDQSVELFTDEVSNVDVYAGTAIFNANMVNVGNPSFTERGFYYGTNPEPTINDFVVKDEGKKAGKYSVNVNNLELSQTYYVRAYAIQNGKTIYAPNTVVFNTMSESAKVVTSSATSVTSNTAVLNAYVSTEGSPAYTERGFCYATHSNPTIVTNNKVVSGTGLGDYSLSINNLEYKTTYYYRAYVIQNEVPIYGNIVSFETTWQEASVLTLQPTKVTSNTATLKGQVTNAGDPKYTVRGFCYDINSNPTIYSQKVEQTSSITGTYTMDVNNLQGGETYYVRAYLRQGEDVIYGDPVSFTTIDEPIVSTENVTNIKGIDSGLGQYYEYSVQFNGTVYNIGSPAYYERGFVYGTSSGVNVSTGTKLSVSGTSTGKFSATTTVDIWTSSYYYVRAYVRTSNGYFYGEAVKFNLY